MSKIDDLIAQYCPNGVEYKKLNNVCDIANNKRKPVKSTLRIPGKTPYYGANNIQDYVDGFTHEGNYVLVAEDGSASLDNYSIQYTKGKFWANNHIHVIKSANGLSNRFLFHYLRNMNFRPFLSGGERAKLTKTKMITILIPTPPLPVQQEIVKILDTFTELEAELEVELEARKKQYKYYRDELLSFDDKSIFNELGDIAVRNKGTSITASKMKDLHCDHGVIRIFAGGNTVADVNEGAIPNKDITLVPSIIVKSRGYIGFEYYDKPFSHKNELWSYSIVNKNIDQKFVYYYLLTQVNRLQRLARTKSVKLPQLATPDTDRLKIPIPPLAEQERIVAILDKFDALVNDITIGLPAEITARRQQYEYYRNQLLTFKEV